MGPRPQGASVLAGFVSWGHQAGWSLETSFSSMAAPGATVAAVTLTELTTESVMLLGTVLTALLILTHLIHTLIQLRKLTLTPPS